jgi:hypothetical protein
MRQFSYSPQRTCVTLGFSPLLLACCRRLFGAYAREEEKGRKLVKIVKVVWIILSVLLHLGLQVLDG